TRAGSPPGPGEEDSVKPPGAATTPPERPTQRARRRFRLAPDSSRRRASRRRSRSELTDSARSTHHLPSRSNPALEVRRDPFRPKRCVEARRRFSLLARLGGRRLSERAPGPPGHAERSSGRATYVYVPDGHGDAARGGATGAADAV